MDKLRWNKGFALEQAADDIELLNELLQIFKESSLSDYRLIEKGVINNDSGMICGAAHSIKGASASLGLEGIKEIAREIETDSRKGSLQTARQRFADLGELLALVQQL